MNQRMRHLVEVLFKELDGFRTTVFLEVVYLTLVCLDESAVEKMRGHWKVIQEVKKLNKIRTAGKQNHVVQ